MKSYRRYLAITKPAYVPLPDKVPIALRQYVWRTRMIYSFYYGDFRPLAVG
jgi:hypothetical protein